MQKNPKDLLIVLKFHYYCRSATETEILTRSTTTTMTETLDYDPTTTTTEKKQNVRSDAIRVVQSLRFSTTQSDYVQIG